MATTPLDRKYQAAQEALANAVKEDMISAFQLLEMDRLRLSIPKFIVAAQAIVNKHSPAAAAAAIDYYTLRRKEAGIAGVFRPQVAPTPSIDAVEGSIRLATRRLWTSQLGQGVIDLTNRQCQAVIARHVLNVGRQTVISTVATDPKTTHYRREAEGNACDFCEMLVGRGAVYVQETADFESHDHCACAAVPEFND